MSTVVFAYTPIYNPMAPSFRVNPYPDYKRMREVDPVHWYDLVGCWVLTRYRDIKFVLSDPRFGIALEMLSQAPAIRRAMAEPFQQIIKTQLLSSDPPDHTRIRGHIGGPFTPPRVETLRPLIQRVVDERIECLLAKGRFDFIADFAYAVPFTIICEVLGIPAPIRQPLERWTHDLMRTTSPIPMSYEETECSNQAAIGFRDFFLELAKSQPTGECAGDLFFQIRDTWNKGQITEEEMIANLILLFCAGHDTVVNLFGNGILALHRNPPQLDMLKKDRSLARGAVEELLRYDASVQIARRTALEWVEVGERWIGPGQYVLCILGAGNRDPDVFPNPDRLDITRKKVNPLSFGGGVHYCLGAQLARVEGEIVFSTLLDRLPNMQLETLEPDWSDNVFVRGLKTLWATV